ncbi:MAG: hypothetical protein AAFX78_18520 [Cyanobacteria bacterium J06638_20]
MMGILKNLSKIFSAEMPPQYSVEPKKSVEAKPAARPPEPEASTEKVSGPPQSIADCYLLPVIDESSPGFVMNPRAAALTKLATQFKQQGDMDGAIAALEAAETAMAEGKTTYGVDTYCKLPLYLQQAGRGEEATQKLIALLEKYPPSWGKKLRRDRVGMFNSSIEKQRSIIYDKLRLVLQRDAKFQEAIPYAVLAETYSQRIDHRIYQYVAKKWAGKPKPPEPDVSDPEWLKAGAAEFEWHEFQQLKEQYADIDETPELRSVKALLKKLKKVDSLPAFQNYARDLISDFRKPDDQIISELREIGLK